MECRWDGGEEASAIVASRGAVLPRGRGAPNVAGGVLKLASLRGGGGAVCGGVPPPPHTHKTQSHHQPINHNQNTPRRHDDDDAGTFSSSILAPSRPQGRGALTVVAAGGNSMGNTLRGTKRCRTRTSGFRTRMQTANGRKVLAMRRKKGRKVLCPASQRSSGGKK